MAVMMTPREKWTDERLDDHNKKVDQGFAGLKAEMSQGFDRVEANLDRRFEEIARQFKEGARRFKEVDSRLARVEDGFLALNRTLFGGAIVMAAALIGSNVL